VPRGSLRKGGACGDLGDSYAILTEAGSDSSQWAR
jgi:hypothetical protein